MQAAQGDGWLAGDAYEAYMGRWSRPLARAFVDWLAPAPGAHWLDLGCGTGALTGALYRAAEPASVVACDPAAPFIDHARRRLQATRVSFVVAGADALPARAGGFDGAVSGLVLNFLPQPAQALAAILQRVKPGGSVAAYVWDYAQGMEFLRRFWDAALALDAGAAVLDEGRRFPLCQPAALASLFEAAGLEQVQAGALEIATEFDGFEDYWGPFLRGTGPAPSYVSALDAARREQLRQQLERSLPAGSDGRIRLRARAWAVRGVSAAADQNAG